jgi:hypothetical protein
MQLQYTNGIDAGVAYDGAVLMQVTHAMVPHPRAIFTFAIICAKAK